VVILGFLAVMEVELFWCESVWFLLLKKSDQRKLFFELEKPHFCTKKWNVQRD
jgi:hypothetical protein